MIEVYFEEVPADAEADGLIRETAEAALRSEAAEGDLTVVLANEERIRELNRVFRDKDSVTDVLTFPADRKRDFDGYLGDIMICQRRAEEQAQEYGHSTKRELAFLTVHGVLHLLGYDHTTLETEAVMIKKQEIILEGLGLKR
ncbi:MAG: rRNA maturation RNase YbeY [Clostridia bacterium]|nr:rRNA maturation RNase YbeY [Clostridia bacterium]